MTIQQLFVASNDALLKSIDQITDQQWEMPLPPGMSRKPSTLQQAVQYHSYDDAWVPEVLAGKTMAEVDQAYEFLLTSADVVENYKKYNHLACDAVAAFDDLERVVHLSYGDYPAAEYLQHIISFRAFRAYDIAKMIGADTTMNTELIQALSDEFSPVIETYRQMGVFPPAVTVADDASPQVKLLAMAGRD